MKEAKFKIGDRVITENGIGAVVRTYDRPDETAYVVELEDTGAVILYFEEELELVPEKKEYSMTINIDIAQNVVIASLFEKDGESLRPLAKGHGHLIHEGALGIGQAASYACKKLYESLGGTLTKGGSWK